MSSKQRMLLVGALAAVGAAVAVAVVVVALTSSGSANDGGRTIATVAPGSATRVYRIPSGAMEPALRIGDHVRVDLGAYASTAPALGDIVLFHPPAGAAGGGASCGVHITSKEACPQAIDREDGSTNFIKRIVAGPGDSVTMRGGYVYRNGKRESGYTVRPCPDDGPVCDRPAPVVIPVGHEFLLGDNRGASDDSRFWGAVPVAWVVGRVANVLP